MVEYPGRIFLMFRGIENLLQTIDVVLTPANTLNEVARIKCFIILFAPGLVNCNIRMLREKLSRRAASKILIILARLGVVGTVMTPQSADDSNCKGKSADTGV